MQQHMMASATSVEKSINALQIHYNTTLLTNNNAAENPEVKDGGVVCGHFKSLITNYCCLFFSCFSMKLDSAAILVTYST